MFIMLSFLFESVFVLQVRFVYAREGQWLGFTICDGFGMKVSSQYISSWPWPKESPPPHTG